MELTIEVPVTSLSALQVAPEQFGQEMKKAAAVKWYELHKISQAKAAELCGVTRTEFLKILSEYQVSIIQYDELMLDWELEK